MESRYESNEVEARIYKAWEESGYFNPDNLPGDRPEPFTIIMPPPNANGSLHAGHALFITIEDLIIRYQRMRGKRALWFPGADHAGFETQIVYERQLEKEGRTRMGMDRAQLYKEIMDFTLLNKKGMEDQVRSLGASCDWSREKFTLDPAVVTEVQHTFIKMFNDNLIYRSKRPVNWCIKHQTSLSDVETETKEVDDILYFIKYGPFVVATVRPETIFGDVAIAVHPGDARYQQYVGQTIDVPSVNGVMKLAVVADDTVDKDFGTGALKITPAHDANDFALAQRHNLPVIEVIDRYGKLNDKTGKYAGMKIAEARKKVAEDLTELGLMEKTEPYKHAIPTCYKCNTTIEPRVMDQWFVNMKPLAEKAAGAVRAGKIKFFPERFEKTFLYWMDNTIDWNISRQIVWGIRIPAWFNGEEFKVSMECPGEGWIQDTDVFDTWFSSGQWPLITLGYPDGKDLKMFYPTQVMETGYDLIFKWIPRMVIFGLYLKNEVPFTNVYLHGLVLDPHGKKMSKSKGNVLNPLDLTNKYGTDALRMALVVGNPAGSDLALSEDKIRGYRNFATKIWNIARFIDGNRPANLATNNIDAATLITDRAEAKELAALKEEITKHIDDYEFHLAAEKIYHYTWHTLADKIIEAEKNALRDGTDEEKNKSYALLEHLLLESLIMLHPFMPFITEEVYQIFRPGQMLMIASWR